MKNKFRNLLCLIACLLAYNSVLAEATMEDVDRSFFPYKDGFPQHDFVKPGVVINASNVDKAKDVIDPELIQHIKDGWVEIEVGEPFDLALHENYIKATKDHLNEVSLGDKPGAINGFVAGRAFVKEPDTNDPRAGEKLAWNFKYGYRFFR